MSPGSPDRTPALVRADVAGLLLAVAGVLFGRPDLVLLAVPMLVYSAHARLGKPEHLATGLDPRESVRAHLGDVIGMTVRVQPRNLTTFAVAAEPHLRLSAPLPSSQAIADDTTLQFHAIGWGTHRIGPVTVVASDVLGAWRTIARLTGPAVAVQPRPRTVKATSTISSPIGSIGRHPSRRKGSGSHLVGIDPYRPGDPHSRINWKATSRTGVLQSNVTELERDTDVLVVLDTSCRLGLPGRPDTVDLACSAVSALVHHYAWLGDRVSVHDSDGRLPRLPYRAGRAHAKRILDALGSLDLTAAAAPPARLPSLRPGTLTFFCSPLLTSRSLRLVDRLRTAGADVVVLDVLPASYHGSTDERATLLRLRALDRRPQVAALTGQGVLVAPWQDDTSLVPLLRILGAPRPRVAAR